MFELTLDGGLAATKTALMLLCLLDLDSSALFGTGCCESQSLQCLLTVAFSSFGGGL